MYFDEHAPPHFHAYYGSHAAQIEIESGGILNGKLPPRALRLVVEWTCEHREELMYNWERAEYHQPLNSISPLE